MTKPLFRMTRNEMHDELLRRQKLEQQNQLLLIAAFQKVAHIEQTIDNTFYKFFNKPQKQEA